MYLLKFTLILSFFIPLIAKDIEFFCPPNIKLERCFTRCSKHWSFIFKKTKKCYTICERIKCICKPEYELKDNRCVKSEKPSICPPNTFYTTCKSTCEPKCGEDPDSVICPLICDGEGCECHHPYALDEKGNCIERSKCPKTTVKPKPTLKSTTKKPISCPPNMVYTDCLSSCKLTCDEDPDKVVCDFMCRGEGCECVEPFALDKDGNCIERSKCPKSKPKRAKRTKRA
ncbi:Trypsin Inhibitor-like, cysteine rich domain-containing protein [Strongyloides ratti]|uniref:Trypsin Inhibitor-like, cysteine rich domain-containing protein n=1 Tax=Strongyloides ratti TaxID=34506 RepID=A0A090KXB4_STRRB|nr:Trypsin Inhibitor-like, cysteine rich domain-containing protein [Strongyloides ratti]CEF60522.1 Trypsin Inhibitor-like, cysteine rich domain-containing protein [Strongyloides ratti]